MKIKIEDLVNNWSYWFRKKNIMAHDVFIELDGKRYELSGIDKRLGTISYVAGENIYTIPLLSVEYVIADEFFEEFESH